MYCVERMLASTAASTSSLIVAYWRLRSTKLTLVTPSAGAATDLLDGTSLILDSSASCEHECEQDDRQDRGQPGPDRPVGHSAAAPQPHRMLPHRRHTTL